MWPLTVLNKKLYFLVSLLNLIITRPLQCGRSFVKKKEKLLFCVISVDCTIEKFFYTEINSTISLAFWRPGNSLVHSYIWEKRKLGLWPYSRSIWRWRTNTDTVAPRRFFRARSSYTWQWIVPGCTDDLHPAVGRRGVFGFSIWRGNDGRVTCSIIYDDIWRVMRNTLTVTASRYTVRLTNWWIWNLNEKI